MDVATWRRMYEDAYRQGGMSGALALVEEWRHARLSPPVRSEILLAYTNCALLPKRSRLLEALGSLADCYEWTAGFPGSQAPIVVDALYACSGLRDWKRARLWIDRAQLLSVEPEAEEWLGRLYLRMADIRLGEGDYADAIHLAGIANGYHSQGGYGPYSDRDRLAMLCCGHGCLLAAYGAQMDNESALRVIQTVKALGCSNSGAAPYWHVAVSKWALEVEDWSLFDHSLREVNSLAAEQGLSDLDTGLGMDILELRIRATHAVGEAEEAARMLGDAEEVLAGGGDRVRLERLRGLLKGGV